MSFRERPDKTTYYLDIALAVAQRSTCLRSGYGAIAVLNDRIVSTGYNGSRRGAENCCDRGECFRANSQTRTDYYLCPAIHSEVNCLLNAQVSLLGATVYIAGFDIKTGIMKTGAASFPCVNCYRAMTQAGIAECFVYRENRLPAGGSMKFWNFLED